MATTEQRSGFRLPWTSEPRSTSEPPEAETPADTSDRPTEGATAADDAGTASASVSSKTKGNSTPAGADGVEASSTETETVSPETSTVAAPPIAAKRPTKFLADLTRAMQAAAEEARTQAVSQLEAEAKAYIESIHSQSAGQASELRKRADDDVATIREWSKAELARVREATEDRIVARKSELEAQLERHAGVIEHEVERVKGQVGSFEAEMTTFFEDLLREQDPTRFAALAESLPEPPPFGTIAMDLDELLASATLASSNGATTTISAATTAGPVAGVPDTSGPEASNGDAAGGMPELSGEEALASFKAAVEAASHAEAEAARAEVAAERAEAAAETTEHNVSDTTDGSASAAAPDGPAGTDAESDTDGQTQATGAPDATSNGDAAADATSVDPRIHALGLDGFDAAEAEAIADAADDDEIPTIDDDALSARIDGLMPDRAAASKTTPAEPVGHTSTTQVVVVGLVSVASIASFKRHLGRIPHVQSVGVSSGPDGEFVFAVVHTGDVSLREVVATLPGFQARVTNTGDGVVNVTAHDPESEG